MLKNNLIEKTKSIFEITKADAIILLNESNMHYFCGFSPSEGVIIITKDGNGYHFVDSRYTEIAEEFSKETGFNVIEIKNKFSVEIGNFAKKNNIKKLAFEDEYIKLKDFREFKDSTSCDFIGIGKLLLEIRNIKSKEEIDKIKHANSIAEKSFMELLNYIKPGKTEKELASRFDFIMATNGSESVSFDTILLTGSHTSLPHGTPSDKIVKNGDFMLFDFGATFKGYHSDMTRTVAIGYADEEMKKDYQLVLNAQIAGIDALAEGKTCKEVYFASYNVLERENKGKYFRHSLGHGIGLDIHEGYNVSPGSKDIFKIGNVTSIEPGIYLPDKYGIRIEDMCIIGKDGVENISKIRKDLIVI